MSLFLARGEGARARELFDEWFAQLKFPNEADSSLPARLVDAGDALVASGRDDVLTSVYAYLVDRASFRLSPFSGESADALRGLLALRLGDTDAAERHYRDGLEWAQRPDVRFGLVEGRCLQGLADVAEARGDHTLALEHLDAAGAKFAEYGAKLYLDQVLAKKEFLKA